MKIVFATDQRFLDGLRVALSSLLRSTKQLDDLTITILHPSLSKADSESLLALCERHSFPRTSVFFLNVEMHDFTGVKTIRGSKMTYARMLIPELFPDDSEVVYCDCDILLLKGLDDILQLPSGDFLTAGAEDDTVRILRNDCAWDGVPDELLNGVYFNCGLIRINLDLWRKEGIGKRAIALAKSDPDKCRFWDQSVLNYLCAGRAHIFDSSNNLQLHPETPMPDSRCANIHYVGAKKPWALYLPNESFRLWRRAYAENVHRVPVYALRPSYLFLSFAVWFTKVTACRDFVRRMRRRILGW